MDATLEPLSLAQPFEFTTCNQGTARPFSFTEDSEGYVLGDDGHSRCVFTKAVKGCCLYLKTLFEVGNLCFELFNFPVESYFVIS